MYRYLSYALISDIISVADAAVAIVNGNGPSILLCNGFAELYIKTIQYQWAT